MNENLKKNIRKIDKGSYSGLGSKYFVLKYICT